MAEESRARERAQEFIDALRALEEAEQEKAATPTDVIVGLFAEDATLTSAALRLAGEVRNGREGAAHFWTEYKRTIGNARTEFHAVVAADNAAGLFWRTGVPEGDRKGGAPAYDGATLLAFNGDGKIARFDGYYDIVQLDRAFGGG